jgi:hypothetical protein
MNRGIDVPGKNTAFISLLFTIQWKITCCCCNLPPFKIPMKDVIQYPVKTFFYQSAALKKKIRKVIAK